MHWDGAECEKFGKKVILALGYEADKNNEFSKGEWGAFSSWLFSLKMVCKSGVLIDELKCKMIEKACWVNSPKCKKKRNKSALLTFIMAGELASRGITLPDARASPKAVNSG
jgi:hypothetical protein